MSMQKQQRHQQYMAFRAIAEKLGFGRIRQSDFRTRFTIDTDGAQEAAANVEWKATFLNDSLTAPLALRTNEPQIASGQALPNEYLMCIRALSFEHDQHITTESDIELEEICSKLGQSILHIKTGSDIVLEKRTGYLMVGYPAVDTRQGALAAAAAPTVRGRLHKMEEGDDLDDPLILFPGGSVAIVLNGQGQWTGTDDVPVDVVGHGWIAMQGEVAKTSKVIGLADALNELKSNEANLRARAKV